MILYRPPDTRDDEFLEMCRTLTNKLNELGTPLPEILVLGDFNFPNVNWEMDSCIIGNNSQLKTLNEFTETFYLQQLIKAPTRVNNILDLVWSNNADSITVIDVTPTCISDHNVISVDTTWTLTGKVFCLVATQSLTLTGLLNWLRISVKNGSQKRHVV